jgi:hypothetical protein
LVAGTLGCTSQATGRASPVAIAPRGRPVTEFTVDGAGVFVAPAHFEKVGASLAAMLLFPADATTAGVFTTTARSGARGPLAESGNQTIDRAIGGAAFGSLGQVWALPATVACLHFDGTVTDLGARTPARVGASVGGAP